MNSPVFTGVDIPYASLRPVLPSLKVGTVTLLSSWTTIGKTALAVDLARRAALDGVPTLYLSGHEKRDQLMVKSTSRSWAPPAHPKGRLPWGPS